MKRCLVTILALIFALFFTVREPTAQAAPGDFLFQWGTPHLFSNPMGVAVDGSGNLYVTEFHKVQVFSSSGALLRSWGSFGTANGQFRYPYSVAVSGTRVYVCDSGNDRIQVFDGNGTFLTAWGSHGTGDGMFYFPESVATDAAGNVYVADTSNSRIQIFNSDGTFIRAFGSPAVDLDEPTDLAVDGAGNIYVVDGVSIKVFDNLGNFLRSWTAHGTGGLPESLALDSSNNVYVGVNPYSDFYPPEKVQVFTSTGTFLREWGSFGFGNGEFFQIGGLDVDSSGNVYVGDINNQRIQVFNSTGTFLRKVGGVNADGQFYEPMGAATDAAGNVYVTDTRNARIQVFDSSGNFLRKWGSLGSDPGQFAEPIGLALDSAGNVYVGDIGGGELGHAQSLIQVFSSSGDFLRSWPIPAGDFYNEYPAGVAVDGGGRVFVSDRLNHRIMVFSSTGTLLRTWGSQGSADGQLSSPMGIALDASGNVYVAEEGNHRVQVFTAEGVYLRKWGSLGGGDGQFYNTAYLAIDASGNVYVTDLDPAGDTRRVQVFDSVGNFLGKWGSLGSAPGQFLSPQGVAVYSGTVYVVDRLNHRVAAFSGFRESLPAGWSTRDVGCVRIAGKASFAGGTFTVKGSGADIWGTADAFRYVYKPLTGDGQVIARVVSLQNTSEFAKAGIMMRRNLSAGSPHAMMAVTPGQGAEFSRRFSAGGSTSVAKAYGVAAPQWVKLVRRGSTFTGYVSSDGIQWKLVGSSTISMGESVYVGLIVTSHNNSALCTATFDAVSLFGQSNTPTVQITSPAAGARYTAPATVAVSAAATPGSGATVEKVEFFAGATQVGTATASPYGVTWNGVPAGSYSLTARVTDSNGMTATSAPVAITVGAGWQSQDIGTVGVAGSLAYLNGVFTLKGSGADVWGNADAFRFVYRVMSGDGQIIARVASLQNTNPYAKGGVMMRQSLAANSAHATMDLKPTGGAEFLRRVTAGATTSATAKTGPTAPYWVKLVRRGSTFTGSVSADGVNWVQVGSSTINMTGTVYVGLIVNSHNNSVLCTAVIDHVQ